MTAQMKKIEKKTILNFVIFILAFPPYFFFPTPVFSEEDLPSPPSAEDELDKELQYLKAETYVVTASRIPENIKKTASSVTVITDKEIRQTLYHDHDKRCDNENQQSSANDLPDWKRMRKRIKNSHIIRPKCFFQISQKRNKGVGKPAGKRNVF